MLKSILCASALLLSGGVAVPSHAGEIQIPVLGFPGQAQFGIPAGDIPALEARIQKALAKAAKFSLPLKQFSVDWTPSSLRCLAVENEMDPDVQYGIGRRIFGYGDLRQR